MIARSSIASGFRSDINGLRAWAVVSVVLYHFGIAGFDGGFVGVDLFFVISGFLMTGIVVSGLEQNRFRLFDFYLARAWRILPALLVLCAVLLAAGWWLLMPMDYKELATHVVVSVLFLSNVKFWTEAGYFDTSSHEKWLLHTWSLAAEWQFYLLLPLVLLAVWKMRPGRRGVQLAMAVALLVSLALSVVLTPKIATAAFYLLPTRAWEMLAGGMAYLLADRSALWTARQRRWLEVAGVALLAGAIAGFDSASPWPGWRALVPVLGTAAFALDWHCCGPVAGHPFLLSLPVALAAGGGTQVHGFKHWFRSNCCLPGADPGAGRPVVPLGGNASPAAAGKDRGRLGRSSYGGRSSLAGGAEHGDPHAKWGSGPFHTRNRKGQPGSPEHEPAPG